MNKKVVMAVVAVVLVVAAFVAGGYLGPRFLPGASTATASRGLPGAPGPGGPMANLSAEERAKVQNMSDEERRAFFQQQFGGQGGQDVQGGPGMRRGGGIEGEVLDVSSDQITIKPASGGSMNVYVDANTVIAYAKGVEQKDLAKGDKVTVVAQPEADGVMSATTIVVK